MNKSKEIEIIIRKAKNQDFDEVSALLQNIAILHNEGRPDLFKPGVQKYSQNEFNSKIIDPSFPIFVAEQQVSKKILAYAFCEIIEHKESAISYERKYLYIDDLCVDEFERGKNIGYALMDYLKAYAIKMKLYSIELNVWEFNFGAIAFYEKFGMHTQRRQMELIL